MHRDRGVRGSLLLFPPLPPLPPFLDHAHPHFPWPCFCDVRTIWAPGTGYSRPGRINRISYRDTSSNRLSQHPSCLRHSRCNWLLIDFTGYPGEEMYPTVLKIYDVKFNTLWLPLLRICVKKSIPYRYIKALGIHNYTLSTYVCTNWVLIWSVISDSLI